MLPIEVLTKKREKKELTKEEINFFITSFVQEKIPDYQMSAFLMAGYLNGFTSQETYFLTDALANSGETVNFSDCDFPTVDKHSTGGVGDKTSLILGPIVAACDVGVPMIAGRGLGHTGGTIDKLEAIPGFNCSLTLDKFKKQIQKNRLCIIAQTNEICPADKKIYALRDVTATIESVPLICASIMSKKLAEGISSLVLDVKYGSGAFMKSIDDAKNLGLKLQKIGKNANRQVSVFLTSMDQPVGEWVGNSVEIEECISILKDETSAESSKGFSDTRELSLMLSAEMLCLSGVVKSFEDGYLKALKTLESGKAFEKFAEICKLQGGDLGKIPKPTKYLEIKSVQSGFVEQFNTKEVGLAGIILKAGRQTSSDKINPSAGIRVHKKIGDAVSKGDVLWTIMSTETTCFEEAKLRLEKSINISEVQPQSSALIAERF
jgi:pyrimidine-nucleoside phosphorylase